MKNKIYNTVKAALDQVELHYSTEDDMRNPADIRSQNPVISVHFFCDFYRRLS